MKTQLKTNPPVPENLRTQRTFNAYILTEHLEQVLRFMQAASRHRKIFVTKEKTDENKEKVLSV